MTIRDNGSGSYEASVQIDGRRHYATFTSKTEAKNWKAQMRADASRHDLIAPTAQRTRFAVYAERWLASRNIADGSYTRYESVLRNHVTPRWGRHPLGGIIRSDIEGWVGELRQRRSPQTAASALQLLSMVLNAAVGDRMIRHNPATDVSPPKWTSRPMVVLEPGEFEAIVDHLEHEDYRLLVTALVFLGCRWSEAIRLDVSSVNWLRSSVTIDRQFTTRFETAPTKAHERRVLTPIPEALRDPLTQAWQRAQDRPPVVVGTERLHLLFTTPELPGRRDGCRPLNNRNFRERVWYPAVDDAGLDDRPRVHDLRHTCAAWMLHGGVPLPVVSKWLGHRTVMTTANVYSGMMPSGFERAGEALSEVWDGRRPHTSKVTEVAR